MAGSRTAGVAGEVEKSRPPAFQRAERVPLVKGDKGLSLKDLAIYFPLLHKEGSIPLFGIGGGRG